MQKIKYLLSVVIFCTVVSNLNGQCIADNLVIDYTCKVNIDLEEASKFIPKSLIPQVKRELQMGIKLEYKLTANEQKSKFELIEKLDNSQNGDNLIVSQITQNEKHPIYKNFNKMIFYKHFDVGRSFLVKDSIPNFKWKIEQNAKTNNILGYKVIFAKGIMLDSIKVNAWYAPKIHLKDGPNILAGLPGLILKAQFEINGFKMTYTATKISYTQKDIEISLPKGKVVTNQEFFEEMRLLEKRQREMYEQGVDDTN